jgi:outer membrane autotransporter protein
MIFSIEQQWQGAARRLGLLLMAGAATIAPQRAMAQLAPITSTSQTRSATITVLAPSNPAAGAALLGVLGSPSGQSAFANLASLFGPGFVSQAATQSQQISIITGPALIPVGSGPGTVNCSGAPPAGVWPAPNCNFAGYATLNVDAGFQDTNTNTHTALAQTANLSSTPLLRWLTGDLHADMQTVIIDGDRHFLETLLSHTHGNAATVSLTPLPFAPERPETPGIDSALAYAKAPPKPAAVAIAGGWSLWLNGTGAVADYGGGSNDFGFRSRMASIKGGVEYAAGAWFYGVAAEHGYARVTQDITGDHGGIHSTRLGIYGGWQPEAWSFSATAVIGLHDVDTSRLDVLPPPLTASYGARTYDIGAEVARRFAGDSGTWEPFGGVLYTALHTDSFAETGNIFAISGSATDIDALKTYAGLRYTTAVMFGGYELDPQLRARLSYDFLNDTRGYTAHFVDDPSQTPVVVAGVQPDRTAVALGASIAGNVTRDLRATLAYDAELRGRTTSQWLVGGLTLHW